MMTHIEMITNNGTYVRPTSPPEFKISKKTNFKGKSKHSITGINVFEQQQTSSKLSEEFKEVSTLSAPVSTSTTSPLSPSSRESTSSSSDKSHTSTSHESSTHHHHDHHHHHHHKKKSTKKDEIPIEEMYSSSINDITFDPDCSSEATVQNDEVIDNIRFYDLASETPLSYRLQQSLHSISFLLLPVSSTFTLSNTSLEETKVF